MTIERVRTYIKDFDNQIQSGIPKGSIILIVGTPGTCKSTLAYSILYHNALEKDRHGLYLSLEQRKRLFSSHLENVGFDVDDALYGRVAFAPVSRHVFARRALLDFRPPQAPVDAVSCAFALVRGELEPIHAGEYERGAPDGLHRCRSGQGSVAR